MLWQSSPRQLLSPAKRSFVEQRMRVARGSENISSSPRVSTRGAAPLSFAQEDLWHMEQSAPGSSTCYVPRAMRIVGPLDLQVLRAALAALVVRHEVLRTTVESVAGEPRAVVQNPRQPAMQVLDMQACAPNEREAQLDRLLREAAAEPFDLTRDLLLRATVVVLGAEEHAVALLSHHFASDESSARIPIRRFCDALQRVTSRRTDNLAADGAEILAFLNLATRLLARATAR
jgi:hypothetical protein